MLCGCWLGACVRFKKVERIIGDTHIVTCAAQETFTHVRVRARSLTQPKSFDLFFVICRRVVIGHRPPHTLPLPSPPRSTQLSQLSLWRARPSPSTSPQGCAGVCVSSPSITRLLSCLGGAVTNNIPMRELLLAASAGALLFGAARAWRLTSQARQKKRGGKQQR